jgi:heme exporter protein CcmD
MSAMGVVEGGWEFVWAAYGLTALILGGYCASIAARYRSERSRAEREEGRGPEVSP